VATSASPNGRKAPTLYSVAELAGVSHQTVSRVVKGETNIRADLRERIEAAILELGYKPNLTARALASSSHHRIGAIVYDFLEVGPSRLVKGASDAAKEAGYVLDIVSLDPRQENGIEEAISAINPHDLAGLLVIAPSDPVLALIDKVGFSMPVYIESEGQDDAAGSDHTENHRGMRSLVDHLVGLGHRRFFQIPGPTAWLAARARESAYSVALDAAGCVSIGMVAGDWTSESGYRAAMSMPLDAGVTAVVVGNDQMALGVLAALADRGIRVPEDISVVGFDDIPEAQYFRPALTTVRQDFEAQGRAALGRLLAVMAGDGTGLPTRPETHLVVRASTGVAPE
jgi:DNA-binding LacI/PurR family transcriptional regulator